MFLPCYQLCEHTYLYNFLFYVESEKYLKKGDSNIGIGHFVEERLYMTYRILHHLPSKEVWNYHCKSYKEDGEWIKFTDLKTGMVRLIPKSACSIEVTE